MGGGCKTVDPSKGRRHIAGGGCMHLDPSKGRRRIAGGGCITLDPSKGRRHGQDCIPKSYTYCAPHIYVVW